MTEASAELKEILENVVFIRGENRPLGQLTLDDIRSRAAELRSAVGWGPTVRVAPIARAWAELAQQMERQSAGTVAELSRDALLVLGPQLWIKL